LALRSLNVTSVGEVLWDVIGDEKHLGGAPFNFAAHCQQLGAHSAVISRVGEDELGDEILKQAAALGLDGSFIQHDTGHATGQVQVMLRQDGQPSFKISADAAWDYLEATQEAVSRAAISDVFCFGTLAQRHATARESIHTLLESAKNALVVCDLNLRSPHYEIQTVRESITRCNLLKLNDDELAVVQEVVGPRNLTQDDYMLHLLKHYDIELLCVTRGAQGCVLRTLDERIDSPGYSCQVIDAVGSGDAFTAALALRYMAGDSLAAIADFANLVGAYVATQRGAIPLITGDKLQAFAAQAQHNNRAEVTTA